MPTNQKPEHQLASKKSPSARTRRSGCSCTSQCDAPATCCNCSFGTDWPWLDAYGATAPAEFFAVACEAYFVNRERFALEFPGLVPVLDAFFRPGD